MSPALSQASHRGLQHDDPETWLNIEEDLVGAGVDAASVGSEHELIKRFVNNMWAGGVVSDNNSGAHSEEFNENGPDSDSNGRDEEDRRSRGDSASIRDSKEKINDLQEIKGRPPAPKTRSTEDSDPLTVGFRRKNSIRDWGYPSLWDQVTNHKEPTRSGRTHAYKKVEALLLCWHQSCSDVISEREVKNLKAVFETRFGYHTTVEYLHNQNESMLQAQLNLKVAAFLKSHDDPYTLFIIYYAGHGRQSGYQGDLYLHELVASLPTWSTSY